MTLEEKQTRAEEIATMLSSNKTWHSHGQMIGLSTLSSVLRLRIEDYSTDEMLRAKIVTYNGLLTDYIQFKSYPTFLHSRCCF